MYTVRVKIPQGKIKGGNEKVRKSRENKILKRIAVCMAAGMLVLSSCTACGVNIYSEIDSMIELVIECEDDIAQISSIVGSPVTSSDKKDNEITVSYGNGVSYMFGLKRDGSKLIYTSNIKNVGNTLSDQQIEDIICLSFKDYTGNQDVQKTVDGVCQAYEDNELYNNSFRYDGVQYDVLFVTNNRGDDSREVTLQLTVEH